MQFVLFICGVLLVGLVLAYAVLAVEGLLWRRAQARRHRQIELDLLEQRVEAARAGHHERREAADESWRGYRRFQVRKKVVETDDIYSFQLFPYDRKPLPRFRPGQALTLRVQIPNPDHPDNPWITAVRCYSLSHRPNRQFYQVSIKLLDAPADAPGAAPGLVSSYFHRTVKEGDLVAVKAPTGDFVIDPEDRQPLVLIAGGVGVTPMLSMLSDLAGRQVSREVWLFYGVRTRAAAMRLDFLESLAARHDWFHLHMCYSRAQTGDVRDPAMHHAGRVSPQGLKAVLPSNNYVFMVCGPPALMETMVRGLHAWGVPQEDVHVETFGAATVRSVVSASDQVASDVHYRVRFTRSGKTCTWNHHAASLLELAHANGVPIDTGCRAGNCGTCATVLRAGDVRYVVAPRADPEAGTCLVCIATPTSDVELDA